MGKTKRNTDYCKKEDVVIANLSQGLALDMAVIGFIILTQRFHMNCCSNYNQYIPCDF